MDDLDFTDLDRDPQLREDCLALLRNCPPGRYHAVAGEPARMGLPPRGEDLDQSLGVLIARRQARVVGLLAICPYSDEQVTLWGPVVQRAEMRRGLGRQLLAEARSAIAAGGFTGLRVLVDERNRDARAFLQACGLTVWKDNLIYERRLDSDLPGIAGGVSPARQTDRAIVAEILAEGFPHSDQAARELAARERQGYRYLILQDGGEIVGAAALLHSPGRSWLHVMAIAARHRGNHRGTELLAGILHLEAGRGALRLGLEVLADNAAAIHLYESLGFQLSFRTSILTGPA